MVFKEGDHVVGRPNSDLQYKWANSRALCRVNSVLPIDPETGVQMMYVSIEGFLDHADAPDLQIRKKIDQYFIKVDVKHFRKATRSEIIGYLADQI